MPALIGKKETVNRVQTAEELPFEPDVQDTVKDVQDTVKDVPVEKGQVEKGQVEKGQVEKAQAKEVQPVPVAAPVDEEDVEYKPENRKKIYKDYEQGDQMVSKNNEVKGAKSSKEYVGKVRCREIDIIRMWIQKFEDKGYEFVADGGNFNLFSIYKEDSSPLGIMGLKSTTIHRKRMLNPSEDKDMEEILDISALITAKELAEDLGVSYIEKSTDAKTNKTTETVRVPRMVSDVLMKLDNALGKGKSSQSNILSEYAKTIAVDDLDKIVKTSHSGKVKAHKVVPQANWFPAAWESKVDITKLLGLLPETEQKSLMLALGRVLAGPSGVTTAEGIKIEHTFRAFSLIVGHDAGLGKSSLFSTLGIIGMLEKLGFTVGIMSSEPNRFSWSDLVMKDFIYLDDLTDKSQSNLFKDATLKSIISNSPVKVDQKFVRENTVKARAAVVANTNNFNYSDYITMDSGFISRLNALSTKRSQEIWDGDDAENTLYDLRPLTYWRQLAADLNTTVEGLALYLLRKSYEFFMQTIGYDLSEIENGTAVKNINKDVLHQEYLKNRENYRISCDLKHKRELVRGVAKAVEHTLAYTKIFYTKKHANLLEKSKNLTFSYELVLPFIIFMLKSHNNRIGIEEAFNTEDIAWQSGYADNCRRFIDMDFRANNMVSKTPEKMFEDVVSTLSTKIGFGFPKKRSSYANDWEQETFTFEVNSNRLVDGMEGCGLDDFSDNMREMMEEIKKLIEIC